MKYLGIDYGTKRIGLAIGDDEVKTAVVFGTAASIDEVVHVAKAEEIDTVIVGAPYSVADAAHELPEQFQHFVSALKAKLPPGVTMEFTDERLSSKYADSLEGDKKTKASRDEIAAVSILQGYLDRYPISNIQ